MKFLRIFFKCQKNFTKSKWKIEQAKSNMFEKSVTKIIERNTPDDTSKKLMEKHCVSILRIWRFATFFLWLTTYSSAIIWNSINCLNICLQFLLPLDWSILWTNCWNILWNARWCKNAMMNCITNIEWANANKIPPPIS